MRHMFPKAKMRRLLLHCYTLSTQNQAFKGGPDSKGVITKSTNDKSQQAGHSIVEVQWRNGTKSSYRAGHRGFVDIKVGNISDLGRGRYLYCSALLLPKEFLFTFNICLTSVRNGLCIVQM